MMVMVSMRDGTRLATDVHLPSDARDGAPTLLMRSPYGRTSPVTRVMFEIERALDRGYAVVTQDTRGRFASEGLFAPFRPEIEDGFDTVDWIARQPFSDGSVVMAGSSYLGATQWLAALSGHPALKAIAPALTSSDYHEGWIYQGGAFQLAFNLFWAFVHLVPEERRRREAGPASPRTSPLPTPVYRRSSGGAADFPASQASMEIAGPWLTHTPLADVQPLWGAADYYFDWLENEAAGSPYWAAISPERNADRIHCPVLTISGWYQLFLRGAYRGLGSVSGCGATETARTRSAMMIGPWENSVPGLHNTHAGMIDFGPEAGVDFEGVQLDFFDGVLGRTSDQPSRVRYFTMGRNEWRRAAEWPPRGTVWTPLFAGPEGRLTWARPDCADAYDPTRFDPADPAPTLGGNTVPGLPQGARDHRAWLGRPDVVVYRADPLDHALEITGPVSSIVHLDSTAESVDVVVMLAHEKPDGRLINICDGIRRMRVSQLEGGVEVDLLGTSIEVPAGDRLVLLVGHSNFPRFDLNGGTAAGGRLSRERAPSTQRILRSSSRPTRILLPVVGDPPGSTG